MSTGTRQSHLSADRRISRQGLAPSPSYDYHSLLTELEQTIAIEREKNAKLQFQLDFKSKKEKELLSLLRSYNDELHGNTVISRTTGDSLKHFEKIKGMHQRLIGHISDLQSATGKEITKQERTLVKTFNTKLTEMKDELESEKKKKVERLQQLEENEAQLAQELELMKASVVLVGQQNQELYRENQELKLVVKTQSEVEAALHLKLHHAKWKLTNANLTHMHSLSMSKSQEITIDVPTSPQAVDLGKKLGKEMEDSVVKRLQTALVAEKRKTAKIRQELADLISSRTEMEKLLKACVSDVHESISKHMSEIDFRRQNQYGVISKTHREQVISTLLAQEQVLALIYQKAFPATQVKRAKIKWTTMPNSPLKSPI